MIMATQCPQKDSLVDFLLGKLENEERERLEHHLSDCSPCIDTVRSLELNDTLEGLTQDVLRRDKSPAGHDSARDSQLISGLIKRLESLPNHGQTPTSSSTADSCRIQSPGSVAEDRAAEVQRLLATAERDGDIGKLGRYHICELLGAGSSGVVYLADDQQLNRPVALKILRPSLGGDARERFLAEAQATAKLAHQNIVSIFDVGIEGPLAYIAMQWQPGQTLEQKLENESTLSATEVQQLGTAIASGLAAAHGEGLIHRDIKPANIWIPDGDANAKILDFGLVRVTDENPQLTCTGMIAGTPCYMSPEQSRGESLDARSDLFSLGCLLYKCATGMLPFHSDNALATLQAIQRQHPDHPATRDPSVDRRTGDLTMMLLEKSRHRRPESAMAVAELLAVPTDQWKTVVPEYDVVTQASLESKNEAARTAMKTGSTGWFRWSVAVVAIGLLGWAGFLFSPDIIRIVTNQGEIIIDSKVDDVEIEVLQGGERIKLIDTKTNQSIDIKAGEYQLRPVGKNNSILIDKETLTLKRGGQVIVKVTNRVNRNLANGRGAVSGLSKQNNSTGDTLGMEFLEPVRPKGPHRIAAGDVLAIYINGVLGDDSKRPLTQTEDGPVIGYPINVNEHGEIKLPLVENLPVAGKTPSELEDLLKIRYTRGTEPILREAFVTVSFVRNRFRMTPANAGALPEQHDPAYDQRSGEYVESTLPTGPHRIAAGDVLAVYIDGVLDGGGAEKPLIQTKNGPVIGYPINVNERGEIKLPLIENLSVAGKTASELEDMLQVAFKSGNVPILNDGAFITVSFVRSRFRTNETNATTGSDSTTSEPVSRLPVEINAPRYKGKTLAEWRAILRTERDMGNLTQAVRGAMMLGGEVMPAELRNEVVDTFRIDFTAEGDSTKANWRTNCRRFLSSLSIKNLYEATYRELESGNRTSQIIIKSLYAYDFDKYLEARKQAGESSALEQSKQFVDKLIATENDRILHYPVILPVAHELEIKLESAWIEKTFEKYFETCIPRIRFFMVDALHQSSPKFLALKLSETMALLQDVDFQGFQVPGNSRGLVSIDSDVLFEKPMWIRRTDGAVLDTRRELFQHLDSPNFEAEEKRMVLKAYVNLWKSIKPRVFSKERIAKEYWNPAEVKRQQSSSLKRSVLSMKLGAKRLVDEFAAMQMAKVWDYDKVVLTIAEAYAKGQRVQFPSEEASDQVESEATVEKEK